jgi:hypothetical protein
MAPAPLTQSTRTDLGLNIPEAEIDLAEQKRACSASGGFWDEATQTCVKLAPKPEDAPEPAPITPTGEGGITDITNTDFKTLDEIGVPPEGFKSEVPRDPETGAQIGDARFVPIGAPSGAPSGAGGGSSSGGGGGVDAQTEIDILNAEKGGIGAAQALQQKQAQAAQAQRIQEIISTIGTVGNLTPAQQASINKSQALTAGTVGSIPSILATAGTFAVGGAIGGGPVGAAIGAGVGIIAGIARGIIGNIKEQQRGELQASKIELTNARTNMRQLAMLASQDPQNADVYIAQYNAQLTRVHQARRKTKAEVSGDLNAWMEDGREQLSAFDDFLISGGIADVYGQKLRIALASGVPLDISGEEFLP